MSSTDPASAERSGGPGGRQPPGLYVVATPIGNLADVTLRALEVLRAADVIACEDTRMTARLLARHAIATATTPYHEHNAARAAPALLQRLRGGAVVALVSDAGTPLVSDPGARLVAAALGEGIAVVPVPGPSAALAALAASGLPTGRFLFAGFLPSRAAARRKELAALRAVPATLIFFESPRRLAASLADMAAVLGDREAAVGRELTKKFEEFRRGTLDVLAADQTATKGEITIVVGPPPPAEAAGDADIDAVLDRLYAEGVTVRDAVTAATAAAGAPRRQVYARANRRPRN